MLQAVMWNIFAWCTSSPQYFLFNNFQHSTIYILRCEEVVINNSTLFGFSELVCKQVSDTIKCQVGTIRN